MQSITLGILMVWTQKYLQKMIKKDSIQLTKPNINNTPHESQGSDLFNQSVNSISVVHSFIQSKLQLNLI